MSHIVTAVIGIVVGLAMLITGLYYRIQEKDDAESRKIYGSMALIGLIVAVLSLVILVINLR